MGEQSKRKRFIRIPQKYLKQLRDLKAVTILSLIIDRMQLSIKHRKYRDDDNLPFVNYNSKGFEDKLYCSRKTCYSARKKLEEQGFIITKSTPDRLVNRYYLSDKISKEVKNLYNQNDKTTKFYRLYMDKFDNSSDEFNKFKDLKNLDEIYLLTVLEDRMQLTFNRKDNLQPHDGYQYHTFANNEKLCKAIFCTKPTCIKHLNNLENIGLISRKKVPRQGTEFYLSYFDKDMYYQNQKNESETALGIESFHLDDSKLPF